MKLVRTFTFLLLFAYSSTALAESKEEKLRKKMMAITPEKVEAAITLHDDSFETAALITTLNVFQEKQGLLGMVPFDNYFRAFIDKKTGATKFQIYITSFYYGNGWINWSQANYETPSGPKSISLDVLGRDVGSCSQVLGCSHTETVAFDVEEPVLRDVASHYDASNLTAWRYKLRGQNGGERIEGFIAAEIVGLLNTVDAYKRVHHLPS